MRKLVAVGATVVIAAAAPCSSAVAQHETPRQAIDPSWLSADTASKTATFELIAALTGLNGGLNFNGFRDGELTFTVPVGWTVVMHFWNHDGMLPHSAEVIDDVHPLPTQPVTPAFARAVTVRLAEGLPPQGRDDMRFIADKGGSYLIFCGVPGHGAAGMWIRLAVSGSTRQPSLAATPASSPSPRSAKCLADAGAGPCGEPAALSSTIDSLSRGGARAFLSVTPSAGEKLDEHYWWEGHVPTRLDRALAS